MRVTYLSWGVWLLAVVAACSGRSFESGQTDAGTGGATGGSSGTKGGTGGGGTSATGGTSGGGSGGTSGGSGGTGGTSTSCFDVSDCSGSQYCAFSDQCLGTGACRLRPQGCDLLFSPVCGCDGFGYGSACEANINGVDTGQASLCGVCPIDVPQGGGACPNHENVECTYGVGARPECRTQVMCTNGTWQTLTNGTCTTAPECVDATPPVPGAPCTVEGSGCEREGKSCICSGCGMAGPCTSIPVWNCFAPPPAPCPDQAPNRGTLCRAEDTTVCAYGTCAGGMQIAAQCVGGVWDWEQMMCPQ